MSEIDKFAEHMHKKGKHTAAYLYAWALKKFENHLVAQGKDLSSFTVADVSEFINSFDNPHSANTFVKAVRAYLAYRVSTAPPESYIYEDQRYHSVRDLITYRKIPKRIQKISLRPEEVRELLDKVYSRGEFRDGFYSGVVCLFYFGWRPGEAIANFANAEVRFKQRFMKIVTAKTQNERVMPWAKEVDSHVRTWHKEAKRIAEKYVRYREYITKNLRTCGKVARIRVTAKTARRTFQTQMRKAGVEEWMIDFLLGHATTIPDIYSDYLELLEDLREPMERRHYLLRVLSEFQKAGE